MLKAMPRTTLMRCSIAAYLAASRSSATQRAIASTECVGAVGGRGKGDPLWGYSRVEDAPSPPDIALPEGTSPARPASWRAACGPGHGGGLPIASLRRAAAFWSG
ncbi:uncharacterized protein SCHCODRAFT_02624844 [Schizophyllum commune H4-8]|uniref:uncharacterized protein n=1 Tax=Schizophyllum commune (strain H4-8 / FGSC 9210) TaxID=578458 RepID=UPI002160DB0D|nr:uncharacterized protein SCHCODRAFT_02624844 [Schizophyllum commune H4-8]KAI5891953.1 hypothetical protein SCHCODRAFT_02624844 [Schizophyllum commune H4-8]